MIVNNSKLFPHKAESVNAVTLTCPQVSCVVSMISIEARVAIPVIEAVTCIPSTKTWDQLCPEGKYEH